MNPLSYGALEDPKLTPSSQLVIAPPWTSSPAAEGAPVGDDAEGDADRMDPTTICTPDIDFMERRQYKKEATLHKTAVEIADADGLVAKKMIITCGLCSNMDALEGGTEMRRQIVVVLVPCASACMIIYMCVCTQGRATVAFNHDLA